MIFCLAGKNKIDIILWMTCNCLNTDFLSAIIDKTQPFFESYINYYEYLH